MTIEERVWQLETLTRMLQAENRWLRPIGGLALAALAVLLLTGQGKPDERNVVANEVTARSIVILGDTDKKRAWLGVDERGTAGLRLFDPAERERSSLLTEAKGGSCLLLWGEGRQTVTLAVTETSRAFFRIFASNGPLLLWLMGGETLDMAIGGDLGPAQMHVRTDEAGAASLTFEQGRKVMWSAPDK